MADDPRLLALLERFKDVQVLTEMLVADVGESASAVIESQRPASRRAYVRTVFALVEGAQSGMSAYLLEGDAPYGWQLSDEERRVFWDAVPTASADRPDGGRATVIERLKLLVNRGRRVFCDHYASVERPGRGRATMIERLKRLVKTGRRVFGDHCQLDFSGADFQAFRRSIAVRDRLMHPKRSRDLAVRDEELEDLHRGREWFRAGAIRFFEAAAMELTARIAK